MSLLYARFYAALLGGILLASALHKCAPGPALRCQTIGEPIGKSANLIGEPIK